MQACGDDVHPGLHSSALPLREYHFGGRDKVVRGCWVLVCESKAEPDFSILNDECLNRPRSFEAGCARCDHDPGVVADTWVLLERPVVLGIVGGELIQFGR